MAEIMTAQLILAVPPYVLGSPVTYIQPSARPSQHDRRSSRRRWCKHALGIAWSGWVAHLIIHREWISLTPPVLPPVSMSLAFCIRYHPRNGQVEVVYAEPLVICGLHDASALI